MASVSDDAAGVINADRRDVSRDGAMELDGAGPGRERDLHSSSPQSYIRWQGVYTLHMQRDSRRA